MADVKIVFIGQDKVSRTMKGIAGSFGGLGKSVAKVGVIAGGVVAGGLAAAAGGFAAFAAKGTRNAIRLEQQIANIKSVASGSEKAIAGLGDLILDLGVDPGLKVSTFEAADAIELLARNGLDAQQILDGAAKSTVQLANATGADFGAAADVATDVMALFNIKAGEMGKAVDGITSVTNNSKFSFDDYRYALANAGGVAASAGVDFKDMNTTLVATSSLFGSGGDAGTSFKTFIARLAAPTNTATEAMKQLGLATEEGANLFFDSSGQMKSMAEIAGLLSKATAGLSEEQRTQALSTIFGSDAVRTAIGLATTGEEKFRALQATMAQTSAAENVKTRMDTLSGALEILQGTIEGVGIKIGQALLPGLKLIVQAVQNFVSTHAEALTTWFAKTVTWAGEKLPGAIDTLVGFWTRSLVPAFQNALNFMQTTLLPVFTKLIGFIQADLPMAIKGASNIFATVLIPAFKSSADFVVNTLIPTLRDFRDKAIRWFEDFSAKAKPLIDDFVVKFQEAWKQAGPVITDALRRIGESINKISAAFGGAEQKSDSVTDAVDTLGQVLDGVVIAVQAAAVGISLLASGFEKVARAIQIAKDLAGQFSKIMSLIDPKIPAILRPGSPPPLAVAMMGIADASKLAAQWMGLFGSAAKGAAAAGPLMDFKAIEAAADTGPLMDFKAIEAAADAKAAASAPAIKEVVNTEAAAFAERSKAFDAFKERIMSIKGLLSSESIAHSKKVLEANLARNRSETLRTADIGFIGEEIYKRSADILKGDFAAAAKKQAEQLLHRDFFGVSSSEGRLRGSSQFANVLGDKGLNFQTALEALSGNVDFDTLRRRLVGGGGNDNTNYNNQQMNLTINSSAPTENMAADFQMMQARMAAV